ncbi:uncharacterized protein LOC110768483 [Prunus avium]|uniref:Uncharacterized protein LOC110768483 n=1 Tax=Prunus avium TaxID=42229 RepID=A0A6P5TK74_PRUAV|nr:uncharacterized protein LOC110768483 [Prunus avium]
MAVDQGLFPIDVQDWRRFERGTTLGNAWKRIKRTIDWSDPETKKKAPKIWAVAEQKLNHLWKKHKANLKKNWYDPFLNSEERWNCNDDRVSKEQWRLLVKYWETGPAQKRSITNKCNRAKCRMHHTTGTKSYAQVRNQYKVNHRGVSPDRCKMFELCHLRKNGTPVNETAAKAMESMNSKIIDIRNKKKQNQLPDEVTTEEINIVYAEVLGREKGNRVRGYGIGLRIEDVLGVLREKRGLRLEFDDMRESYEERIVQVTKDANEREERIKREMREEGRATTEKVKRLEQLLTKQQAIMEKVLASASNVSNIDSELLLGHVSSSTLQVALGSNRLEEIMTATLHSPYMPSQTLIDQDGYRPIIRGIEEEEHARNVGHVFKV